MTRKNKKRQLDFVETVQDDPILGSSSLTDSDDDDAGLLTWVASLDKVSETQFSNMESEPQLNTTVDNIVVGLALQNEDQDTQEDNTREVKKKKKMPHNLLPFPGFKQGCEGLLHP
jgi:hypothetical protein